MFNIIFCLWCVVASNKKPPLCKGRWIAKQDGGIVDTNQTHDNPSGTLVPAPFTQGSHPSTTETKSIIKDASKADASFFVVMITIVD